MLIGIVGKPNVGKSTFFKALTLANVEIANYPFATIKPNHGKAYVKVECVEGFFNTKCNPREGYCIDGTRFVPVDLIDVAGLVPGAHEGKGMGNQFLDDLRQADALIHVIDASGGTNEKGESVEPGSYNPAADIKFLEVELDYWYLQILNKQWEKLARQLSMEKQQVARAIAEQLSALRVTEDMAKEVVLQLNLNVENPASWTEEQLLELAIEFRKRTKPMIIAANKADTKTGKENMEQLKKDFPNHIIVPCSAESELALREASKHELIKYIPGENEFEVIGNLNDQQTNAINIIKKEVIDVYKSTGVQEVVDAAVFKLLQYIPIFPGGVSNLADKDGNRLPDCFLLPPKSTALDFAFHIHTDLGKGFIRAVDVKTKRTIGKEHLLQFGDVIEIISK